MNEHGGCEKQMTVDLLPVRHPPKEAKMVQPLSLIVVASSSYQNASNSML